MNVVALTGGIASGKTVVARLFREHGAATVDADQLARSVVQLGTEGYDLVVKRFGEKALTRSGEIDREQLGKIVFAKESARRDLEAIVHPRVFAAMIEWIEKRRAEKQPMCVLEIPLLFEVETPPIFGATICVLTSRDVQIERLKGRSEYDDRVIAGILDAQMDPEEKARRADYVIDNNGDLDATGAQVAAVFAALTQ
jgi:dephospho-CoA kinase